MKEIIKKIPHLLVAILITHLVAMFISSANGSLTGPVGTATVSSFIAFIPAYVAAAAGLGLAYLALSTIVLIGISNANKAQQRIWTLGLSATAIIAVLLPFLFLPSVSVQWAKTLSSYLTPFSTDGGDYWLGLILMIIPTAIVVRYLNLPYKKPKIH